MVSRISGPIPAHDGYDKLDIHTLMYLKVPVVARAQHRGTERTVTEGCGGVTCLALEVEGHSMPSAYKHTKVETKNHVKENMRRIRQIQKTSQSQQQAQAGDELKQPVKALWKLSQFDAVPSRVKEQLQRDSASSVRPQSANSFLRAHSRTGYVPQSARPASVEPPDDKLTVPKAAATARDTCLIRRDIDFLKLNSQAVKSHALCRSPSLSTLDQLKKHNELEQHNYRKGELPKYLVERRKQWRREEQERQAREADAEIPAGHRLMSDDERLQTLDRIQLKRKELMEELSSMPIRNDTQRIRTKRDDLERQIDKVDEALKTFSRKKVFVRLDL